MLMSEYISWGHKRKKYTDTGDGLSVKNADKQQICVSDFLFSFYDSPL